MLSLALLLTCAAAPQYTVHEYREVPEGYIVQIVKDGTILVADNVQVSIIRPSGAVSSITLPGDLVADQEACRILKMNEEGALLGVARDKKGERHHFVHENGSFRVIRDSEAKKWNTEIRLTILEHGEYSGQAAWYRNGTPVLLPMPAWWKDPSLPEPYVEEFVSVANQAVGNTIVGWIRSVGQEYMKYFPAQWTISAGAATVSTLPIPDNATHGVANGLNANGVVFGMYSTENKGTTLRGTTMWIPMWKACKWVNGRFEPLPIPDSYFLMRVSEWETIPSAINSAGLIGGYIRFRPEEEYSDSRSEPVVWTELEMIFLNDHVPEGADYRISGVLAIGDNGEIVCSAKRASDRFGRGFVVVLRPKKR